MASKRDQVRYELVKGREVVYRGITNDPERREAEHRAQGKQFDKLRPVGSRVTEETARRWEAESLQAYRKNHGGKNPKYNQTQDG